MVVSTEWIEGGPEFGFGGMGNDPAPQPSYLSETGDSFVFRNKDGSVHDIQRRLAADLDQGLGPQVRPYSETLSMNDVFEAERIRQQRDPAHDQGAFDGPTLDDCKAKFPSSQQPFKGVVKIADHPIAEITSLSIDGLPCREIDAVEAPPAGQIDVTGSVTVYYQDSALLDQWLRACEPAVDPLWKRELLWTIHNLIAHPISEITYWIGALIPPVRRFGEWLHDLTIPAHAPNTGRG